MPIIRTILPEAGDVLPAKEKIHRFPGEILQLVPEAPCFLIENGESG